jgi:parallel beta-helix repeat protein
MKNLLTLSLLVMSQSLMAATLTVESNSSIQDVVKQAEDGDTILVEPGLYHQSVYIDQQNITIRGLQVDGRFAVLDGKMELNDGIIAGGHGAVIDGFHIKGYKGNGIMTQGSNNFKILNNFVEGAFYGIFPQYGKNGLVQGNTVTGAEDAGIYVGMSDNIDVLDNIAYGNVMGIELENCRNSLMANNNVYGNTAGLVVTLIPGLPVKTASDLVLRNNTVKENNLDNFAPASSIAATVPSGIGIMVVGVDNVIIKDNDIEGNANLAIGSFDLVSFGVGGDPKLDPYVDGLQIYNNKYVNNGTSPRGILADMIAMSGMDGVEILDTGKARKSCLIKQKGLVTLGLDNFSKCGDYDKTNYETAQLSTPIESPVYTAQQKGRLTYLAVCTGCHSYNSVLHGPSMQSIQALYGKDTVTLAEYITSPIRKRKDFPEMPQQDYLGEKTINAISNYILNELEQ